MKGANDRGDVLNGLLRKSICNDFLRKSLALQQILIFETAAIKKITSKNFKHLLTCQKVIFVQLSVIVSVHSLKVRVKVFTFLKSRKSDDFKFLVSKAEKQFSIFKILLFLESSSF